MAIKGVIKNSVTADISAEQFASLFESIYGKNGICNVYEKLQCVKIDNNTVRLSSGVYNLSGYMVMVENGTNEDFVIDSGTAGLKRNDLLIAEFVRNGLGSGVDVLTFRIVKGVSVVGAASDPALTVQDISAEGTTRQEALYRIMIDGINITSVVPLAGAVENISSIDESGSNSKGSYIKYANGVLINYLQFNLDRLSNTRYYSQPSMPLSFVDDTYIPSATLYISSPNDRKKGVTLSVGRSGVSSIAVDANIMTGQTFEAETSIIAMITVIGKWK